MNWAEFFYMGGYAFHVWTSWGLSFSIILWILISSKRNNAKIRADIARQIKRDDKLNNA